MTFAGFLRDEAVDMVRCKTVDLRGAGPRRVRARGLRRPGRESRREGPFGDHTGYYSLADDYPVLHLTALTHRRDAIYSTTIVGQAPMEDAYLGKATERLFLPLLRLTLPELVDMDLPKEGGFHNCVLVSVDKRYPLHARKVMHALWGTGQMQFAKCIVVVDGGRGRARLRPGGLAGLQQRRLAAGRDRRRGPARRARPLLAAPAAGRQDRHRRHHASGPRKGTTGNGRADVEMSPEVKARVDELWPSLGLGGLAPVGAAAGAPGDAPRG